MPSPTKRTVLFISILLVVTSCRTNQPSIVPSPTKTAFVPESSPTPKPSPWSIYDADPNHPWNRVFRQLYRRVSKDGQEYGAQELDPLLWFDTTYLLEGDSHQEALRVLDEFISSHAEQMIREPLKRALFQHDLWAVFDWSASQTEPYPAQRQELKRRLAQIIRRVALSKEEIAALPDNYTLELDAGTFPARALEDSLDRAFLPDDLFLPESTWIPMGREGGPIAMTHTQAFPFFGRSVFLIFVRSPSGRAATLDFVRSLKSDGKPVLAIGSEVALVRYMLLVDDQGELVLSPLVETVQIRHFSPQQHFHEFELDRARLLKGQGGLVSKADLFMLFMGHGDVFSGEHGPNLQAAIPAICKACHSEDGALIDSGNLLSVISYSRDRFPLPDGTRPVLHPTTWEDEARLVMAWKRDHVTWQALQSLWDQ